MEPIILLYGNGNLDLFNLLQNNSYYFIYAELDDENGKYYPVEGVTYANAFVAESQKSYFLHFLNIDSWNGTPTNTNPTTSKPSASSSPIDTTISKKSIPFAGNKTVIIAIVVLTILAILGNIQYKRYKDIK